MNQKALMQFMKRRKKELEKVGIDGPFYANARKTKVMFTDGFAAAIVPSAWCSGTLEVKEHLYQRVHHSFDLSKTADYATFTTTHELFTAWLRMETEMCPFCHGNLCTRPIKDYGKEATPDEDIADDLHYGWVGQAALDRRRADTLLSYLGTDPTEEIEVMAMADLNHHRSSGSSGIRLTGEGWRVYVMGLLTRVEAAPKFHIDGIFSNPQVRTGQKATR